ncbi:MAG TPA: hypothetical protein VGU46_05665 [Acidobacteriaceae bacterium]|nr:hypothetical protein [Acidobacteriaceae bacterium]
MTYRKTSCFAFIAGAVLAVSALGQSGRPAAIPRLADGRPNFNGIWQTIGSADMDLQAHVADRTTPAAQSVVEEGTIPYLADGLKRRQDNFDKRRTDDPEFAKCNLPGVPRVTYARNLPFQIFQLPKGDKITVLYEYAEAHRFIYTNGTSHPPGHINWYLGDSRGRWDGDTLVVDSVDFLDDIWLDHAGDYIDQDFHVIERFKYIDADHIDYNVEIDDPKIYSKPWHIDLILYRHKEKNFQLLDYVCYAFPIDKYYP